MLAEIIGDGTAVEHDRLGVAAVHIVEQDDLRAFELSRPAENVGPAFEGKVLEVALHIAVEADALVGAARGQFDGDRHAFLLAACVTACRKMSCSV